MDKKRIGPLKAIAKKSIQKEIKNQERKEKRKLDIEEKREIKNRVLRRLRTRTAIFGTIGLLGLGGLAIGLGSNDNGVKTLPEGQTIELNNENEENARETFVNGIKVDNEKENSQLRKEIEDEIENLTPQEILNYAKGIYAQEYNKNNEVKINVDQISFYKEASDIVIYNDKAENGDEILRYCSEYRAKETGKPIDGDKPILKAYIKTGEITNVEKVALNEKTGEFQSVYSENQEVKQNTNTTLENISEVVLTGINMSVSMDEERTSLEVKDVYKDRFINAVTEYRQANNKKIENVDLQKKAETENEL